MHKERYQPNYQGPKVTIPEHYRFYMPWEDFINIKRPYCAACGEDRIIFHSPQHFLREYVGRDIDHDYNLIYRFDINDEMYENAGNYAVVLTYIMQRKDYLRTVVISVNPSNYWELLPYLISARQYSKRLWTGV